MVDGKYIQETLLSGLMKSKFNSGKGNFVEDTFLNILESISDLKVISAQSWGHIEALWDLRSPKSSSQ